MLGKDGEDQKNGGILSFQGKNVQKRGNVFQKGSRVHFTGNNILSLGAL